MGEEEALPEQVLSLSSEKKVIINIKHKIDVRTKAHVLRTP